MVHCAEHHSWMDIHSFAASRDKDWTYIIFGSGGPTGKTYLCNQLQQMGCNAIELSEDVASVLAYRDNDNHFLVYEANQCVVIILNKRLPEHIYPGLKNFKDELMKVLEGE